MSGSSKMSKSSDKYPNIIGASFTMTAANAMSFQDVNIGFSLFDKAGILIHRLEFDPSVATLQDLDTDGDFVGMALSNSNALTSILVSDERVIDSNYLVRVDAGTAASANFIRRPMIHDFSTLPGGGILVSPRPLYFALYSQGMTVAAVVTFRMYFTIITLSDAEFLELLETRRAYA